MNSTARPKNGGLYCLVKRGLIRELYRQHRITQAQFERLMRLQRV